MRLAPMRTRSVMGLASLAVAMAATSVVAQAVPSFSFGLGIRETQTASGTALGSNGGSVGSIEQVNAAGAGTSVLADGAYHTITFNFGTDLVTNPILTSGGTTNGSIDATGGLAVLEHLRINNSSGVTRPVSIFIDDVVSNGTTITDFQTAPTTITNNTLNVLFREPTNSSTTPALARNFSDSRATSAQPDGTVDAANLAGRINLRFNTPEAVAVPTGTQGWVRLTTSGAAVAPTPVIAVSNGSTLTMRIAIVVNEPLYGFNKQGATDNWSDPDNWGRGTAAAATNAPNGNTATALFDEPLPEAGPVTPRVVNLDIPVKLQNLQFTSAVPHTINSDPTNTLTLTRAANGYPGVIDVEAGSHTLNGPVIFTSDSATNDSSYLPTVWVSPGASLAFTQAPSVTKFILTGATVATGSLTKRGGGTLTMPDLDVTVLTAIGGTTTLAPSTSSTSNDITISGVGARVNINPTGDSTKTITTLRATSSNATLGADLPGANDLVVNVANIGAGAKLSLDLTGKPLLVKSLNLNATAKLDVTRGGVLLDYPATSTATPTTIRNLIVSAYAAGAWNGNGITSASLPGASAYGIGYATLPETTDFMGRLVPDASSIAIRYTLKGDSNLDGEVDFDDLLSLAQNYAPAPNEDPVPPGTKVWFEGDFNYSGYVDFDDLLALAQNYGGNALTTADVAAFNSASFAADWALARSLVPEPTSLGLIGATLTLVARRRR